MNRLVVLLPLLLAGCATNVALNRRSELAGPGRTGPLTVTLRDGTVVHAQDYTVLNEGLWVKGECDGSRGRTPIESAFTFDRIARIEARQPRAGPIAWGLAGAAIFLTVEKAHRLRAGR